MVDHFKYWYKLKQQYMKGKIVVRKTGIGVSATDWLYF